MQPLQVALQVTECCILTSIMSQRWRVGGRVNRFSKHTGVGGGQITTHWQHDRREKKKKAEQASGNRKNVEERR